MTASTFCILLPWYTSLDCPPPTSNIRIVLSKLPLANSLPVGLKSTSITAPICALYILRILSIFRKSNPYTFVSSFPAIKLNGSRGFQAQQENLFISVVFIISFRARRSITNIDRSIDVHSTRCFSTGFIFTWVREGHHHHNLSYRVNLNINNRNNNLTILIIIVIAR